MGGAIVIHHVDHHQRDQVEKRRGDKRRPEPDEAGEHSSDHRTYSRSDSLGGLHGADRGRHLLARGRFGSHGHRQRTVAREQSLNGAHGQHLPDVPHECHRGEQDDKAHQRSLDHDLAAKTIAEAPPGRGEQRCQPRRDAETDPRPHRDLPDVGDTELGDEQRKERHHQREAGVAHERRGGDREDVPPPGR